MSTPESTARTATDLWRRRMIAIGIAALVFVLDQAIKLWVTGPLDLMSRGPLEILPIFRLTFMPNPGVSLGLFTADTHTAAMILVAMTSAIALFVAAWLFRERRLAEMVPLALVLGGALGNICDRVRYSYVVDYADLHFGEFRPFLIFNLADAAITIGVLIILARSLLSREKPETTAETAPES